jgi:hypothetical protein
LRISKLTEIRAQIEKHQCKLTQVITKREDLQNSHISLCLKVWGWGLEIKKEKKKLKLAVETQKAKIKGLKERPDALRELKNLIMKREGLHLLSFSKRGDPARLMQRFVAVFSHNGKGQVVLEVALREEINDLINDELGAQLERLEVKFNNGLHELEGEFIREHKKFEQTALKAQHQKLEPLFKVRQDVPLRMLELQRPLNKQIQ